MGFALSVLSGVFIGTSFVPFYPWALFFAFVPLWCYWLSQDQLSLKKVFFQAWLCQFVLNLIGFYWFVNAFQSYAHLKFLPSLLILLLTSSLMTYYIPVCALLWAYLRKNYLKSHLNALSLLVILFFLGEELLPMIFPWNLGYPWLWAKWPAFQLAEFVGFSGLSAFTFIFNGLLTWAFFKKNLKPFFLCLSFFALFQGSGFLVEKSIKPNDKMLHIIAMQWEYEKVARSVKASSSQEVLEEYLRRTEQALSTRKKTVDIVAWSETAFKGILQKQGRDPLVRRVVRFVKDHNIVLVTGGYYKTIDKIFTGFLVFEPSGLIKKYLKSYLVPFGEYIPFEKQLKRFKIREKLPHLGNFTKGDKPHNLAINLPSKQNLLLGPQVCYEGLISSFSRKLSSQKAQVFFNITNDSWYGVSSEPYQHFLVTIAKAIEYRRPLVRVTNTGLTGYISEKGKFVYDKDLYKMKAIDLNISYSSRREATFYEKFYFLPSLLFLLALIFIILRCVSFRKNERN